MNSEPDIAALIVNAAKITVSYGEIWIAGNCLEVTLLKKVSKTGSKFCRVLADYFRVDNKELKRGL